MKPWNDDDDNGGATVQGVTPTTIKVVVLYGDLPEAQLATKGLYTNQATGENNPNAPIDATKDINEINTARLPDVGSHPRVHLREDVRRGRSGTTR